MSLRAVSDFEVATKSGSNPDSAKGVGYERKHDSS
jgi:hypothetical protein